MKWLSSAYHLFRIFGLRALWVWVLIRLKEEISISLPRHSIRITMRCGTSDEWLLYQIFSQKQYHIETAPCGTIIDLGANIGLATLYLKLLYPAAKVICVEPDEGNFDLLFRNTKGIPNVKLYKAAIGANSGMAFAKTKSPEEPWAVQTQAHCDGNIPVLTIDQILTAEAITCIDLLKIDIEGAEKELFSENFHRWMQMTELIVIELHEHLAPGSGQAFFKALEKSFEDYSVSVKGSNLIVRKIRSKVLS